MRKPTFEIFDHGLRFVYADGTVSVYNTEGTHNLIQSYERPGIDTKIDFEQEVCFWEYDNLLGQLWVDLALSTRYPYGANVVRLQVDTLVEAPNNSIVDSQR